MPLSLLAALCVFPASVTLQVRAQALGLMLPTLSEKVGRRLAIQPTLAREQMVIDVRNVEPDALLARIAEVTRGQWISAGETIKLQRLPETERALAAAERKFHADNLRSQWKAALKAPYDPGKEAKDFAAAMRAKRRAPRPRAVVPSDRYLNELLLQLPIETITSLGDRKGWVLASHPLGLQRPLPASTTPIIARLLKDHGTFTAKLEEIGATGDNDGSPPSRVVLFVAVGRGVGERLDLSVRLLLRDRQGNDVDDFSTTFCSPDIVAPPSAKAEAPSPNPVRLNPVSTELERLLHPSESQKGEPAARNLVSSSAEVRSATLNPERDGRLTQTWSDFAFALAARESLPLVANLPDSAEPIYVGGQENRRSIDDYLRALSGTELRREGGWLTLRPRLPAPAGSDRADRTAAGHIVRSAFAGNSISLEEAGPLLARIGPDTSVFDYRARIAETTGGAATSALEADRIGLDILHKLGPNGRRFLYAGRSIAYSELPPSLQQSLRSLYFEAPMFLPDLQAPPPDENDRDWMERITPAQIAGLSLEAKVEAEIAFLLWPFPKSDYRFVSSVERLVSYMDDNLRPIPTEEGENVDEVRYRVISQRTIQLRIRFPKGDYQEFSLSDHGIDPKSEYLPFEKLPASIRAHMRELKDQEIKRRKDGGDDGN